MRNPNECRDGSCGGCTKCLGGVDEEWEESQEARQLDKMEHERDMRE